MINKKLLNIIVLIFHFNLFSQFTEIPLNTNEKITSLAVDDDTLLILAKSNYFAKLNPQNDIPIIINTGILSSSTTYSLQVKTGNYYLFSQESGPYVGNVHKSIDGGHNWPIIYNSLGLHLHLDMFDNTLGLFGSANGAGFSFTSNGINWQNDSIGIGGVWASTFYNDSIGIFLTSGGSALRTDNRGASWNWSTIGSGQHKQVAYVSKDTIYSIRLSGNAPYSDFSYSYNAGLNFQTIDLGYINNQFEFYCAANSFWFPNSQHGYIFGSYRKVATNATYACIYETNDFGLNWTPFVLPYNNELISFAQINDSIAYIGGEAGLLLKWDINMPLMSYLSILDEKEKDFVFNVYQNFENETLYINGVNDEELSYIFIIDMLGRLIIKRPFNNQISIGNISSGAYLLVIKDGKTNYSTKFIKY